MLENHVGVVFYTNLGDKETILSSFSTNFAVTALAEYCSKAALFILLGLKLC
jgi:hypothetical protein